MKKYILPLCAILIFAACKKEVKELPPATQTGANTFGAMVNGDMWIPQSFGPFTQNILQARWLGGNLQITAQNFSDSPVETEMDIRIVAVTGPGTYPLNSTVPHPSSNYSYAYYVKRNLTPLNEWITSSSYTGAVVITRIDTVNRIASGTFQFTAGEINNSAAALNVSDGRFDVKF